MLIKLDHSPKCSRKKSTKTFAPQPQTICTPSNYHEPNSFLLGGWKNHSIPKTDNAISIKQTAETHRKKTRHTMRWGCIQWLILRGTFLFASSKSPTRRFKQKYSVTSWWHFDGGSKKLTQMFTTESPLYYHTLQFDAGPISWACSTIPPLLPFTLKPTISSMKSFSSLVALAIFMAEAFRFAVETNRLATENKSIHEHVSHRVYCWDL